MLSYYRRMIAMRKAHHELRTGECRYIAPCDDVFGVIRTVSGGEDALGKPAIDACAITLINRSSKPAEVYLTAEDVMNAQEIESDRGETLYARAGAFTVRVQGMHCVTYFAKLKTNRYIE